jgi:hypothetical protein
MATSPALGSTKPVDEIKNGKRGEVVIDEKTHEI